jgi:hypothetical protein
VSTWVWVIVVVVAAAVLAVVGWTAYRKRRSERLEKRFGPEYERTLAERGARRDAEAELVEREKRREKLEIRPLEPVARDRYADSWRSVQSRFVDEPGPAVREADALVTAVMHERGYPMDNFEQRAADISVDYPDVVENYRAARRISLANERDEANTEDLRQAMVHYRALFEELLETRESIREEVR